MHAFKNKRQMQILRVLLRASREDGRCWHGKRGVLAVTRQHFTWAVRATTPVFVSEFHKVVFSQPALNGAPKLNTLFCSFMPANVWVSLFLQKVNEWKGRKINQ